MKRLFARLFCSITIQLTAIALSNAQTKTPQNTLQPPPAHITIDGNVKEWGDSLRFFDEKNNISYDLANDKENLYVAVRISDRTDQMRVLHAGLTLAIDTKGRKKESFALTFPLAEPGDFPPLGDPRGDITQEDRDELLQALMTQLREIKVDGFKDIEGDMITTSNTYGIKTAIDYDKAGSLVYEAAIPLKFFHADDITKNEWAFNFKINAIAHPQQGADDNAGQESHSRGGRGGGGGGRGGHGGGRGGQHSQIGGDVEHSELSKSIDFWEKFYLAS